jgi:hypothetical protein
LLTSIFPRPAAKMKFSLATLALPVAVNAALYSKADYTSGAVHQKLMKLKSDQWAHDVSEGKQDPKQWQSWQHQKPGSNKDRVQCKDGLAIVEAGNANQTFRCNNVSALIRFGNFRLTRIDGPLRLHEPR